MLKTLDFRGTTFMDKTISLVYFQISWIVHSRHHMQLCNQATISRKSSNLSPPQIMELLDQLWEQDYIVYLSGRPPLAWGSTIGNDSSHTWHSGWDPNPEPKMLIRGKWICPQRRKIKGSKANTCPNERWRQQNLRMLKPSSKWVSTWRIPQTFSKLLSIHMEADD